MCDCYYHKCMCCNTFLPFHIADFKYPRTDFKIWCKRHFSEADENAVVFAFFRADNTDEYYHFPNGTMFAVSGPKVGFPNNHPNSVFVNEVGKIKNKKIVFNKTVYKGKRYEK